MKFIAIRRSVPVAGLAALLAFSGAGHAQQSAAPRVVVIGVDGMSADRAERLMGDGKLPNFAALAKRGGYAKLATSNPAQSPVAWATLTTGLNPGGHGIYDFLRRVPQSEKIFPLSNVEIGIGLAAAHDEAPISELARAAIVFLAGAVGAAAGLGVILSIYAGARRALRPHGVLVGTATGVAALFSIVAYVTLAWVPAKVPYAKNLRSGDPFWVALDKKGVRCTALEAPLSFPADPMTCGCCLSGLGTPDAQGTWGSYATWTDDPNMAAKLETGGVTYFVEPGARSFDLVVVGPRNPFLDPAVVDAANLAAETEKWKRASALDWTTERRRRSETSEEMLRLRARLTAHVAVELDRGVAAHLTTAEGVRVDLSERKWSELVPVVFRASPVAKIAARVRFLLRSAGGQSAPFAIFVPPVQFDAAKLPPNAQIASPMSFAADLAAVAGPFETQGWPELTSPVKDDMLGDRAFIEHLDIIRKARETRLADRLKRNDWDCLFVMFSEPDRVQHAFYRHVDPQSPTYDAAAAAEFVGEIDRAYFEMDRIVGDVVRTVGPDVQVLVCSDHGFAPFRRGVNLNNFLLAGGLQTRTRSGGPVGLVDIGGKLFQDVDWSETKAYAMGLGNLYLNLAGREPNGIVKPAEAESVLAQIERGLLALRDPKTKETVVAHVYRGKDLFHGPRAADAPDIVVGFKWGWRVSWQNCLGALDDDVVTDNKFRWSGDHCSVDPPLVPGVLFSSLPLAPNAAPNVIDFMPSLLSIYGAKPADAEGKSFLAK